MKKLKYLTEAALLYIVMFIMRLLPLDYASASGGWIGRTLGPALPSSRTALDNMKRALPGRDESEYKIILRGMWDNIGRVMAEYPHLEKIGRERVSFVNADILGQLKSDGKPALLFTGHLANWECGAPAIFLQHGLAVDSVYREPNNPWSAAMLLKTRTLNGKLPAYPKSRTGTRQIIAALQDGRHIGILIDQKYNEGIPVPFFGIPAMTGPAFIQLGQKFGCPVVPVRIERLNGAHFRVTLHEPLALLADETPIPVEKLIIKAHGYLEDWIRDKPEQWLWLHRRWSSRKAQDLMNEQQERSAA